MKIVDVGFESTNRFHFILSDDSDKKIKLDVTFPFHWDENREIYLKSSSGLRTCSCPICQSWKELGFRGVEDPEDKRRLRLYPSPDVKEMMMSLLVEHALKKANEGAVS